MSSERDPQWAEIVRTARLLDDGPDTPVRAFERALATKSLSSFDPTDLVDYISDAQTLKALILRLDAEQQ